MGDKKVTLKLEKVSKSFAKIETDEVTHALNEIDLTLNSGEFISLVGPSGCGKSTFLRCINRLEETDSGVLKLDGVSYEKEKKMFFYSHKNFDCIFDNRFEYHAGIFGDFLLYGS